jgi:prepilin-type N-terminal cleavage/methylation domain-containing protein
MESKKSNNIRSGFTLIELVVVIGILAVLFAIVLIAINPSKQFEAANDTQRRSDVNAILNDNKGALPFTLSVGTSAAISTSGTGTLCANLVSEYIAALPTDPSKTAFTDCSAYDTGYVIGQTASGRVTVSAPVSGSGITVTR